MKYGVIAADPPWTFDDRLTMAAVKRGAAANYATLTTDELCALPISPIAADRAVLGLWCPASLMEDGYRVARAWGFTPKTLYTWVKTAKGADIVYLAETLAEEVDLAFGMGRQFRGCSEHAIIATRGKPGPVPASKRERAVLLAPAMPHSRKPEGFQDALDRMYPAEPRLELFARRARPNWDCTGLECPATPGVDIRDWISLHLD